MMSDGTSPSLLRAKFDNICLMFLILVCLGALIWIDKHGNGDFEKWLEVFTAGIGGAYLGLTTGARQAFPGQPSKTNDAIANGILRNESINNGTLKTNGTTTTGDVGS